MYTKVALKGRPIKFCYFSFKLYFRSSESYILTGLNGNKSIHINFKVIITFEDDLESNVNFFALKF